MAAGDAVPVEIDPDLAPETPDREKMDLDDLTTWVKNNIDDAENDSSSFSIDRENLLKRYYGKKYGDEAEGYSQVVARDVMETVEWMTAQLLRIFTGERYAEFEPFDQKDVDLAEQQTDYVNHVLMQDCNGTLLLHDWFKEALLLRIGVVHWGYEETSEKVTETYTGLMQEQVEALLEDEGAQITALTPSNVMMPAPMPPGPPQGQPMGPQGPQQAPPMIPVTIYDVEIERIKKQRKLGVVTIPNEEFLIEKNARAIDDARFVGHKTRKTKSDLRKLGISDDVIEEIQFGDDVPTNGDAVARDQNQDAMNATVGWQNESQQRCWFYTVYCKVDWDNDGIDELLRVRYAGDRIIDVEPAMEVPYADLCPIRTPHRFIGLGFGDMVEDVQRIKTVLTRAALDNAYLSVRPRNEVDENNVNLDDLAVAAVGGNIRVRKMGSIQPLITPPMMDHALNMIQYIDKLREDRTGLSAAAMGRDIEQVHDTAKGMSQQVSQAQMRVEMVAKMFAETGVKRLFLGLYNAMVRNQDPPRMVRLRGKFAQVDPREWRERNNVIVNVALGAGTRDAQTATLTMLATMQQQLLEKGLPLTTPKNLQYTLNKLVEVSGYKNVEAFITPPENFPPPPPPPPPLELQIAQIQQQIDQAKIQSAEKQKAAELAYKQQCDQADREKTIMEMRAKEMEAQRVHAREMAKLGVQQSDADKQREQQDRQFYDKLMHDAILAREKLDADAEKARQQAAADEQAMKSAEQGRTTTTEDDTDGND